MAEFDRPEPTVLRELQDLLVDKAQQLVLDLDLDNRDERLANSQAATAMQVAESSETVRVFLNWAHYQAGRKDSERFWKCKTKDGSQLVTRLGADLFEVERTIQQRVPSKGPQRATVQRAVARYLGYMRRAIIGLKDLKAHDERMKKSVAAGAEK